ncbi:MAG: YczE/YyaS/YitT family protein [Thermoleophilaceae bacterium]
MITHAGLGNSPWTVLAEGVSLNSALSIGAATVVISFLVLLAWIPLRQRIGLGTLANAVVVGVALDVTLGWVPDTQSLVVRGAEVLVGIGCVGLGSGLYINAALGPGPRDGLMTGLNRVTGHPIAVVRTAIELCALTAGFLLGGTVGVGTLTFALLVGPAVAAGLRALPP